MYLLKTLHPNFITGLQNTAFSQNIEIHSTRTEHILVLCRFGDPLK